MYIDHILPMMNYEPTGLSTVPPSVPSQQPWERKLLGHVQLLQPRDVLTDHLSKRDIVTCSDGSATDEYGTFGFMVSSLSGERFAQGNGPAPGSYPNA